MIIHAHVIALYIYCCFIKIFENLLTFLASNNWLLLLKKMEKKFFIPNKVVELYQGVGKKELAEVTRYLLVHKHKFKVDYINV